VGLPGAIIGRFSFSGGADWVRLHADFTETICEILSTPYPHLTAIKSAQPFGTPYEICYPAPRYFVAASQMLAGASWTGARIARRIARRWFMK